MLTRLRSVENSFPLKACKEIFLPTNVSKSCEQRIVKENGTRWTTNAFASSAIAHLPGDEIEMWRDDRGRYWFQCPTEDCPANICHWFLGHRPSPNYAFFVGR